MIRAIIQNDTFIPSIRSPWIGPKVVG
jgi:hypothetical protein